MSIITKTKQIQLESHAWKIREHALINRLFMNMYPFPFVIFLDVKVCIAGLRPQSPRHFAWQPSGNSYKP